jgi:hypothetical protein
MEISEGLLWRKDKWRKEEEKKWSWFIKKEEEKRINDTKFEKLENVEIRKLLDNNNLERKRQGREGGEKKVGVCKKRNRVRQVDGRKEQQRNRDIFSKREREREREREKERERVMRYEIKRRERERERREKEIKQKVKPKERKQRVRAKERKRKWERKRK